MALPVEVNPLLIANRYAIQRSLRFRSGATAYLNRTPASAGNQQKFTYSVWLKLGSSSTSMEIFSANGTSTTGYFDIRFGYVSGDLKINVDFGPDATRSQNYTTAVYRDFSSWYHVVIAVDTTQATAANRLFIYINGVSQVYSSTSTIPLNLNTNVNSAVAHAIGRRQFGSDLYFDGYLSEVNFIDGYPTGVTSGTWASTNIATLFGYYNEIGIWSPQKYGGSYGTNGFYLPFNDPTSATTLCYDRQLGYTDNTKNNWTPNNISVAAGPTYDAMTDVPTPNQIQNVAAGNYATLNPLQRVYGNPSASNGNLTGTSSTADAVLLATMGITSGKFYAECTATAVSGALNIELRDITGSSAYVYTASTGAITGTTAGATYTSGDVIGVAYDFSAQTVAFYKNNALQGTCTGVSQSLIWTFGNYIPSTSNTVNWNFGQRPFSYTPPSGFLPLNSNNLPTPTISNGAQYMAATTYTGNGSTQSIYPGQTNVSYGNNPLNTTFQPDFAWIKARAGVIQNILTDAVRGVSKQLCSDTTAAEVSYSGFQLTAFNNNGFTVVDATNGGYGVNGSPGGTYSGSSAAYIGWQWQAGGAPTTANVAGAGNVPTAGSVKINGANLTSALAGSIAATNISANTSAGFSVVTYTGTGSAATVGHGLNATPSMIIVKRRNAATYWPVYVASLGATKNLNLNLTDAQASDGAALWNSTAPTSAVFSVNTSGDSNASGGTFVAYCWAPVANFSAFGSYTGNGSTDGPFIFTGFRPRWIMLKRTDSASVVLAWRIYDTSRNPYNAIDLVLGAESSNAEVQTSQTPDALSNGFKLRSPAVDINASGGTYIYAAFAENPFKFANAR